MVSFTLWASGLAAQPPAANYDEAKVPKFELPDPLLTTDGKVVNDAQTWREKRRPELLRLFEQHVYGKTPARRLPLRFQTRSVVDGALDGQAVRKEVTIFFTDRDDGPQMDLLMFLPKQRSRPARLFLGLNFNGNHAVHPDPTIRLSTQWMRAGKGVV
ncbi:MAG: hypothetical protein AB7F89_25075, partial [Pirellulaceae bacterium]